MLAASSASDATVADNYDRQEKRGAEIKFKIVPSVICTWDINNKHFESSQKLLKSSFVNKIFKKIQRFIKSC